MTAGGDRHEGVYADDAAALQPELFSHCRIGNPTRAVPARLAIQPIDQPAVISRFAKVKLISFKLFGGCACT